MLYVSTKKALFVRSEKKKFKDERLVNENWPPKPPVKWAGSLEVKSRKIGKEAAAMVAFDIN